MNESQAKDFMRGVLRTSELLVSRGEEVPAVVFLVRPDGKVAMLPIGPYLDNKEACVGALSEVVRDFCIEEYFLSFDAYTLPEEVVRREVARGADPRSLLPSSFPDERVEALVVTRFHKREGMVAVMVRHAGGVCDAPCWHDGSMYARWNVWTPEQVSLDDGDDDGEGGA